MLPLSAPLDPTITPSSNVAQTQQQLGPGDYAPTPEEQQRISEISSKREKYRRFRLPHEATWYVNSSMLRGQQFLQWSVQDQRLKTPPVPPHQQRLAINRIRPKIVARRAKFMKNRTQIEVYPARSDVKSKMDARASKKALNYIWRKHKLEQKKRQALMHAETCSKGFWWIYWDPNIMGRVQVPDPLTGEMTVQEALLGDVCVEVGSAYEVLVGLPGAATLSTQPDMLRVKLRPIEEVRGRYPDHAPFITADSNQTDLFRYETQISSLNASGALGGFGITEVRDRGSQGKTPDGAKDMVLVTEHFERPTPQNPKGRYAVVVGNVLVKDEPQLPYGFHDMDNPYPCVEFTDQPSPNQFWSTTLIEQLIPLQREYNTSRSKLAEHIRNNTHPKLIVWKQNRLKPGAWTSESGEVIELLAVPGIPQPMVVTPPPISSDLWQTMTLIQKEFDDISQVYPAAEGKSGGATSGFQTNLLQEATDLVHTPDLQALHMGLEEACYKLRRLMKQAYTVPRIIQAVGKNMQPDIEEFVNTQIDEFAEVVIEGSNALPDNKAIRMQMIKEMFEVGLMGNPQDPEVIRKALSLMELGGPEDVIDDSKVDENQANSENNHLIAGQPIANPEFYQNHLVHYKVHTNLLKSPESTSWPPEQRMGLITHVIGHLDQFNPQAAAEAAVQYGLPIPPNAQRMMMQQQAEQAAAQADSNAPQPIEGQAQGPSEQQPQQPALGVFPTV